MCNIERNNRIIQRRARGSSIPKIAAVEAISEASVRYILSRHLFCISERAPPTGLSVRSAWCIQQAFGIWPSESNAAEIAGRKIDFLRASGTTMRIWREIESWVDNLAVRRTAGEACQKLELTTRKTVCVKNSSWLPD